MFYNGLIFIAAASALAFLLLSIILSKFMRDRYFSQYQQLLGKIGIVFLAVTFLITVITLGFIYGTGESNWFVYEIFASILTALSGFITVLAYGYIALISAEIFLSRKF